MDWTEKSTTRPKNNDQAIFQAMSLMGENWAKIETKNALQTGDCKVSRCVVVPNLPLEEQGGQQGSVRNDKKRPVQKTEVQGNVPCIVEELRRVYRQGGFADYVEGEVGTLRAAGGDYGGGTENILVEHLATHYIVRRLTPTECARLQGFPDTWGHPDIKDDLTDEEYAFWQEVRNTHAAINGKAVKDYTKAQMLTWYNKLHTDSSEYKMWGNGIALPTALYCMQGIAAALNEEK